MLSIHARSVIDLEVRTAFEGARHSVSNTLKSDVEHTVTLRQVVKSFEGQRHVRAALVNEAGKVIVQSQLSRHGTPAPAWFAALIDETIFGETTISARITPPSAGGVPRLSLAKSSSVVRNFPSNNTGTTPATNSSASLGMSAESGFDE